ncbi:MAG: hypothetical protein ACJAZ9_000802, partial [Neolewinella sp.]
MVLGRRRRRSLSEAECVQWVSWRSKEAKHQLLLVVIISLPSGSTLLQQSGFFGSMDIIS